MADIGSTLREARMRARIDISEVEARTKIRAKYLRAIENEEWDLLPGTVFVKSFLKTYGDYLGLDSRMLIDEFKRRYERPSDHDMRPMSALSRERERAARGPRGPRIPAWLVILVILACVGGALYLIGRGSGQKPTSPPPAGLTANHPHGRGGHHRSRKKSSRTTPTTSTTHTVTTPKAPVTATLQLAPTGTVYVCVERRRGRRFVPVIPGVIYNPGQVVPTVTGDELLVTLGNAGVSVKVNGQPYPVAASPVAIGLKITPAGASPLPAGEDPTCA